jgi:tRNA/rRNA methyltransferase
MEETAQPQSRQGAIVILVGTQHPGNAGAAARAAANFGVTDLRFVDPKCDVRSAESLERAVHAKDLLLGARQFDKLGEALKGTSIAVGTTARSTEAAHRFQRKPIDIRDWLASTSDLQGQVAYVFGPESDGLSGADTGLLDQLVTIPTADYWSLNLSHAVALVCYEHFRREAPNVTTPRVLAPDALLALHRAWDDLVLETEQRGYRQKAARGVWRKVIGRSAPDTYEVHNVMGILANALKRFGNPRYATEMSEKHLKEKGLKVEDAQEDT